MQACLFRSFKVQIFSYVTFNKDFFARMYLYEKWEKAKFNVFEAFLSNDEPVAPESNLVSLQFQPNGFKDSVTIFSRSFELTYTVI